MDVADINAAAIPASDLKLLADPNVDLSSACDALELFADERPQVRIDLTDPPSPVVASCAGVVATASDPDSALRGLASVISGQLQTIAAAQNAATLQEANALRESAGLGPVVGPLPPIQGAVSP